MGDLLRLLGRLGEVSPLQLRWDLRNSILMPHFLYCFYGCGVERLKIEVGAKTKMGLSQLSPSLYPPFMPRYFNHWR